MTTLTKHKPSRKKLKNKCDKLWSEIIRSQGRCEVCGTLKANFPHHVIGRRNFMLRWDIRNGCLLCANHHTAGKFSAHNDPVWFMDWFEHHRKDDYEYLLKKKNKIWGKDYNKVLEYLNGIAILYSIDTI